MSMFKYLLLIMVLAGCAVNKPETANTNTNAKKELVETVVECFSNNDVDGILELMDLEGQKDIDFNRQVIEKSMPSKMSTGKWSVTGKKVVPIPADLTAKILAAGKEKGIRLSEDPTHLLKVGYGGSQSSPNGSSTFAGQAPLYLKKINDRYRVIGYQHIKH